MVDTVYDMVTLLNDSGIAAVSGYRRTAAPRPTVESFVYVYPERLSSGRLYFSADVYSAAGNNLDGCMRTAQRAAEVLAAVPGAENLTVSRAEYDYDSMGYVAHITGDTVCEGAGGMSVRFSGFSEQPSLTVNTSVFDVSFKTELVPHPIYTVFDSRPVGVVYDCTKYTVTLGGVKSGLGRTLIRYGMFTAAVGSGSEQIVLERCYVKETDEPCGGRLVFVGYSQR